MHSNEFTDFLPPLRSPRKVRKAKPVIQYRHDYKARYREARMIIFKREYPSSEYFDKKIIIDTTNGFQNYIQDVLNNLGHMCERVNTTGIPTSTGWRRSGSTKGSSDLHVTLNGGRAWKIEIKRGADTLNPSQEKYQSRSLAVGALHSVIYVGDTDMFWDLYDKYILL